jgi:phage protein D
MPAVSYALEIDGSPAPAALIGAIQRIEVEDHAELADMLRLRVAISVDPSGTRWTVVDDDTFQRLANVRIKVNLGGEMQTLISAYVVEARAVFSNQPGLSMLDVIAMDPTVLMNLEEKVKAWPDMSDSDVARAIFGDSAYGFQAVVEATTVQRSEDQQTLLQRGTDIRFLKQLAQRNGYECFVEVNTGSGQIEGHFHPPRLNEPPQPTLTVNTAETTNVNHFRVRHDMLKPVEAQVTGLDVDSREAQPADATASEREILGSEAAHSTDRPRRVLLARTAMADAGELQAYAQAIVDQSSMAIYAEGELTTSVYGGLLRAKRSVSVRGVGRDFSGVYYVERVLHVIDINGYVQRFTLRRNALGLEGNERFAEERPAA